MTKPRFVYNWKWAFWAQDGGPIGYLFNNGWRYCFIEPDDGRELFTVFALPVVTRLP